MEISKHEWLFDDINGLKEKIRFKDYIEYRVSGQLHNTTGPAKIYIGTNDHSDPKQFYIKGVKYSLDEWNIAVRPVKLKRLKKKIEKENDKKTDI